MFKFYETAPTLPAEQDQFETDITEYTKGLIDPVKFKAIRVAHGVYEQRQNDTYMIRIRCAAGGITPAQLRKVAELGAKYGGGEVHFTTRQEVQIHEVIINDVMTVIRELHKVGLSSRGGGGNTIRNILTSVDSGISSDEEFDVDPYAIALTTRMINEDDSWNLPRKFKIAFSNSLKDDSYTQATCLGFVATHKDGKKGFQVYCAGGMGAKPMVGHLLLDFIPDTQVYHVTRAIKTMFDKHGSRRSKTSNRIKFLWKKLDREEFVRLFNEEYDKIKNDESLNLVLPDIKNEANDVSIEPEKPLNEKAFETWKSRYVIPQKQQGLSQVHLPLRLGDLLEKDAYRLVDFLEPIGDNTIRCARGQNVRLRNIPDKLLPNLFNIISGMEQTLADLPYVLSNMVNCTGAQTCKLGICLPRGLSDNIRDYLVTTDLDLEAIQDFRIHMSGCPNTCGLHHIADLGFFGKVGRKDGSMYPAYNVLVGAKVGKAGETEYAERISEIPAHNAPEFTYRFLKEYIAKKADYASYIDYLEAEGKELVKTLCDEFKEQVPTFEENEGFYKDFGAKRILSLDELGTAECSAGMFDMIDVDKKEIKKIRKELENLEGEAKSEALYQLTFHASRMLLVTRGLDAKDEKAAFAYFAKHFIDAGLVDSKFMDVVTLAKLGVKAELSKHEDTIQALADTVLDLYANMDDSLRFKTDKAGSGEIKTPEEESVVTEKDYRGVACPMNFVKTKLVLETMESGKKLQILLDDGEPIQNVPNSVKLEGHKVLEQEKTAEGHWRVLIQKV